MKIIIQLTCIVSPTTGPPGKPFLPQGKSCTPLPGRTTSKTLHSFSVNPSLLCISQLPGQNQQNGKQLSSPPLPFKISLKGTSFHIFINSIGLYFSPRILVEFSLNFLYFTMCGKMFQIYGVNIPIKCIDQRYFYSCLSPLKTCPQVLVITPQAKGNTHSLRKNSVANSFLPTAERARENYDLLYQNFVRKYEDDLEH